MRARAKEVKQEALVNLIRECDEKVLTVVNVLDEVKEENV